MSLFFYLDRKSLSLNHFKTPSPTTGIKKKKKKKEEEEEEERTSLNSAPPSWLNTLSFKTKKRSLFLSLCVRSMEGKRKEKKRGGMKKTKKRNTQFLSRVASLLKGMVQFQPFF
jgi:hypothetical protein